MRTKLLALAGATLAIGALPASAAPLIYGGASWVTARSCVTAAPADPCDGTILPDQRIFDQVKTGGPSLAANSSLTLADGSVAKGIVDYGALDLPIIKGSAASSADTRMNSNQIGYQSFEYTGAATVPFALSGALDFTISGADGPQTGVGPGEGFVYAYLALWDPSVVAGIFTIDDIFREIFFADCTTPGVIGYAIFDGRGLAAGSHATTMNVSTDCAGNPILLSTGSTFLAVAGLQTPANRGGFADAFNTFVVGLDPALGADVLAELEAGLVSARALDVPEPGMLGLLGLSLAGLACGRHRARPSATIRR
jgi:hypothetical protein